MGNLVIETWNMQQVAYDLHLARASLKKSFHNVSSVTHPSLMDVLSFEFPGNGEVMDK